MSTLFYGNPRILGFNHLLEHLDAFDRATANAKSYPPYNILKHSEESYQIELALAGYRLEDLSVVLHENVLTIEGKSHEEERTDSVFLHRGVAQRAFKSPFTLADDVKVTDVSFNNGLLVISLVKEVPEEKKPQVIEIKSPKRLK